VKLIFENRLKIKPEEIEDLAKRIYIEIKDSLYPNWNQNPATSKTVAKKLRLFLAGIKPKYKIPNGEYKILYDEIYEFVSQYEPEK